MYWNGNLMFDAIGLTGLTLTWDVLKYLRKGGQIYAI